MSIYKRRIYYLIVLSVVHPQEYFHAFTCGLFCLNIQKHEGLRLKMFSVKINKQINIFARYRNEEDEYIAQ